MKLYTCSSSDVSHDKKKQVSNMSSIVNHILVARASISLYQKDT